MICGIELTSGAYFPTAHALYGGMMLALHELMVAETVAEYDVVVTVVVSVVVVEEVTRKNLPFSGASEAGLASRSTLSCATSGAVLMTDSTGAISATGL